MVLVLVRLAFVNHGLSSVFRQARTRHSNITLAANSAVIPLTSWGGLTVLTSKATKSRPDNPWSWPAGKSGFSGA